MLTKVEQDNPDWKTIHPDINSRGGYHEWAKPVGTSDKNYPAVNNLIVVFH